MADPTRYRGERGRGFGGGDRERGRDHGSDGGYIARRGFGNARSGYGPEERDRGGEDRGGDWGYPREEGRGPGYAGRGSGGGRDYGRERGDDRREYGDAAGYGGGGSWRDFREVTGRDWDDDRFRNPDEFFRGRRERGEREGGRGYGRGNDYLGGFYGADQGYDRDHRGGGERGGRDERGFLERAGDEIASWFGDDEAARRRARDAGQEGGGYGHRGRGPRNYRRSDERIREDVSDRLMDDPHIDASDIEVGVASGEVVLTGTVESRFAKRHAEDLAESVSGVTHVQNNLRVRQTGGEGLVSNAGGTATDSLIGNASGTVEETGRAPGGPVTGRLGPTSTPRRRRGPVIE
jgi:osmotically-inducible protein OsmY